jgi:hypothetical protein
MKRSNILLSALASAVVILPSVSIADSQLSYGGAGTSAQANLDFRIVIPSFLYFQVGSAGTTDRVDYDLSLGPVEPGSGGPITATGGTGDGADGTVSVTLITNAASVSIAASGADLTGGGALTLPFSDITATAGGGTIPVPDFGATISPFAPGGFSLSDNWSYTYDNTSIYEAGTYNGTATYTVTVL